MEQPGRTYTIGNGYRYSINGQEKTPEIAPNTTTALFWEYDARIVRRWNMDQVFLSSESPYLVFGGNPIIYSDPLGDFKTKFGAKWYRFWNGGGNVGKNSFGEWYVMKTKSSWGKKGEGNVSDELILTSFRYYGKGRKWYSNSMAEIERQDEMKEDILLHGENSIYKKYDSPDEAGRAALLMGLQTVLPNVLIKPLTIATFLEKIIPRGFKSAEQFAQAGTELEAALKQSGIEYQSVGVRGSSVTNVSSKGGGFRQTAIGELEASDIDVYIEFKHQSALKPSQQTPGFIHPEKMMNNFPALKAWSEKWSGILNRQITPGGWNPGSLKDVNVINF